MPKVMLKISLDKLPPLFAARNVETIADLRKLFKDADRVLAQAVKVFPSLSDASPVAVTYRVDAPKSKPKQHEEETASAPAA